MNLQIVHSLLEELGLDQAALILESKAEQAAKGTGHILSLSTGF